MGGHDGPAAIRSFRRISTFSCRPSPATRCLTEMVTGLSQRSSLVIAAWGALWRQGCRCNDHEQLVRICCARRRCQPLSDALMHHLNISSPASALERAGGVCLILPGCLPAMGES